jgi:hypothetical protein
MFEIGVVTYPIETISQRIQIHMCIGHEKRVCIIAMPNELKVWICDFGRKVIEVKG